MAWASVKDKLPEVTQENNYSPLTCTVLVYRAKHKRMCVGRYESWNLEDEEPEFKWVTDCSEGWDITAEVTHWMPLPDPPA